MIDIFSLKTIYIHVDFACQVDIDFEKEPIGVGKDGKDVYFRDIWPSTQEVADVSTLTLF